MTLDCLSQEQLRDPLVILAYARRLANPIKAFIFPLLLAYGVSDSVTRYPHTRLFFLTTTPLCGDIKPIHYAEYNQHIELKPPSIIGTHFGHPILRSLHTLSALTRSCTTLVISPYFCMQSRSTLQCDPSYKESYLFNTPPGPFSPLLCSSQPLIYSSTILGSIPSPFGRLLFTEPQIFIF